MKNLIIAFLLFILFHSCMPESMVNRIYNTVLISKDKVIELNVEDFIDSLSYIKLETHKDALIGEVTKINFYEGLIIIYDQITDYIYLFSKDGKFKQKIGSHGKGPGEYIRVSGYNIYPNAKVIEIFDLVQQKLIGFDLSGNVKYEKKTKYSFLNFYHVPEGYWVYSCFPNNDPQMYNLLLLSEDLDKVKAKFCPADNFFDRENRDNFITNSLGELFFSYGINDTIYKIEGKLAYPYMYIDYGSEKLSTRRLDKDINAKEFQKSTYFYKKFGGISNLSIDTNMIFFNFMEKSLKPTTRYGAIVNPNNFETILYNSVLYTKCVGSYFSPISIVNGKPVFVLYPQKLSKKDFDSLKTMYNCSVNSSSNPVIVTARPICFKKKEQISK